MDFETPPSLKIPQNASLEETMEALRRTLRVEPESRLKLRPAPVEVTTDSVTPSQQIGSENSGKSAPPTDAGEEIYSRVVARGGIFRGSRVDDPTLLTRQHSLSQLRLNLEECRTVVSYLQNGPQRTGVAGQLKNRVTGLTWRMLNWFITPSISFDRSAANALNECAASLDLLSRQVQLIARELTSLSEAVEAMQVSRNKLK
jgi:hypothetical protein